MNPSDAFLLVLKMVKRRPDDAPLERGDAETVQAMALRVQAQAHTAAFILPKGKFAAFLTTTAT